MRATLTSPSPQPRAHMANSIFCIAAAFHRSPLSPCVCSSLVRRLTQQRKSDSLAAAQQRKSVFEVLPAQVRLTGSSTATSRVFEVLQPARAPLRVFLLVHLRPARSRRWLHYLRDGQLGLRRLRNGARPTCACTSVREFFFCLCMCVGEPSFVYRRTVLEPIWPRKNQLNLCICVHVDQNFLRLRRA